MKTEVSENPSNKSCGGTDLAEHFRKGMLARRASLSVLPHFSYFFFSFLCVFLSMTQMVHQTA